MGGQAMSQLWLFVLAPVLGGITAGILSRVIVTTSDSMISGASGNAINALEQPSIPQVIPQMKPVVREPANV
jgi:archaellum component FlaG (FlaF/FlaG flagellin family)